VVFAATLEDGVFCSDDRGATWQAWNFGLFDRNVFSIAISNEFADDRMLYAGTESGIFCSKNGGRAWQETGFPADSAPVLSLAISPPFIQNRWLFAGTETAGLFCSQNEGRTWHHVLNAAPINAVVLLPGLTDTMDILAASDDALWLSRDDGQTWSQRQPVSFNTEISAVTAPSGFTPEAKVLLGMADGQIVWV
jgi:photosystem II stability/assembly factor-like uncharacterized protein